MKTLLALILIPSLMLADGVVLFEKATGILQERYVSQVVTNDDETVSTNIICAFAKLQPKETTFDGSRVLGAQVLKSVDWTVYDLARYKSVKHDPPITTDDLVQVEPFDVLAERTAEETEKQSKAAIQAASESNLVAIATAYGITNRPLDWITMAQVGQQISATNLIQGMALRLTVLEQLQFYTLNGGDPRKVGKKK